MTKEVENTRADDRRASDEAAASPPPTIESGALFGTAREIVIVHCGERYVLRVTRQGKLLLNK